MHNSLLHQVQEKRLEAFFAKETAVTAAANALPRLINTEGFSKANQEVRNTVEDLHFSLYETEENYEKDREGVHRRVYSFYPIHEEFAEYFNEISDDDISSETISTKVAQAFLNLMKSLNSFIRLGNDLKLAGKNRDQDRDVLKNSIELLTQTLGELIGPLDDILKDLLDEAIYKGDQLKFLKRQMNKSLKKGGKSLRVLLHLDRNKDGSPRKELVDQEKKQRDHKRREQRVRKKKRTDQKKARKVSRR